MFSHTCICIQENIHIQWFSMCAKVEPSAYGAKHLWNSEKQGYGAAKSNIYSGFRVMLMRHLIDSFGFIDLIVVDMLGSSADKHM